MSHQSAHAAGRRDHRNILEDTPRRSQRRTLRVALVLVALAMALAAAVVTTAGASDAARHSLPPHKTTGPRRITQPSGAPRADQGRWARDLVEEVATGDKRAMLAVIEDVVDCLRGKGLNPGDRQVQGDNVAIVDWNPGWDSAAGRSTMECSFLMR